MSGLAMMSSTHCENEKVVPEVPRAGAAATDAAMPRATRGRVNLTMLTAAGGSWSVEIGLRS